jgi:hypothetical protein
MLTGTKLLATLFALWVTATPLAAELLLSEDFEDGVADAFTADSGDWLVEAGVYVCHKEGAATWGLSFAGGLGWVDYSFTGRMMSKGGVNHVLRVRSQGDNGYEITVRSDSYHDAYLYKWRDGVRTLIDLSWVPEFPTGSWQGFEFILVGNHLSFVWAGFQVFNWTDPADPYLSGGIALASVPGGVTGWQDAHFDDIIVESLTTPASPTHWSRIKAIY